MGCVDLVDGRTFKVDFSGNGVEKLREKVNEKLKEFMGDYTDDTLVDYIIVLLRNGRRKEEARNELNVFLGDDSQSFVSWLWDHLALNLDLYAETQASYTDEVPKIKPTIVEACGRTDSQHLQSDSERGEFSKLPRSRHNREWKGLMRDVDEPPPLLSSKIENIHQEQKSPIEVSHQRRSVSPRVSVQRKRNRSDNHQNIKTEAVSQLRMAAPRRLLQFAVRDAVAASRPSDTEVEPSPKRLRSVVSSSTGDLSKVHRPQRRRLQSIAMISNPMATVMKAVAEAAEDVTRVKSLSVFDRLGLDMSEPAGYREMGVRGQDYSVKPHMQEEHHTTYVQRNQSGQLIHSVEEETGLVSEHTSGSEEYNDIVMMGNVTQPGTSSAIRGRNFLGDYDVDENDYNGVWKTPKVEKDHVAVNRNSSRKLLNASVSQGSRIIEGLDSRKLIQGRRAGNSKSEAPLRQENGIPVPVGNGNANLSAVFQDTQKPNPPAAGPMSISRHLEDADSQTIFVSNVHFAATKDSLSRHFNKFAEVLKVIIITDLTTGQPTGSAYVEFMRKESAENALSLNGTSFMSRILKVVKKSAAHKEISSVTTWPQNARTSPFSATRYARVAFPRGSPGAFRPRPPMKPGARTFQWKRDAQTNPSDTGVPPRSHIYVRTETKPDGNSGTT